jgi:hypothetical protein
MCSPTLFPLPRINVPDGGEGDVNPPQGKAIPDALVCPVPAQHNDLLLL